MKLDVILRVVSKLLLPFMIMFAFYVQFHGEYGPGGGFQAGVIIAASIILYSLVFGLAEAKRVAPPRVVEAMVPLGVLIYAGVGIVSMSLGAQFLNYSVLLPDPRTAQHYGIIAIELGVLVTVAGTITVMFYMFAGRGR